MSFNTFVHSELNLDLGDIRIVPNAGRKKLILISLHSLSSALREATASDDVTSKRSITILQRWWPGFLSSDPRTQKKSGIPKIFTSVYQLFSRSRPLAHIVPQSSPHPPQNHRIWAFPTSSLGLGWWGSGPVDPPRPAPPLLQCILYNCNTATHYGVVGWTEFDASFNTVSVTSSSETSFPDRSSCLFKCRLR